jgi:hypothetical protein
MPRQNPRSAKGRLTPNAVDCQSQEQRRYAEAADSMPGMIGISSTKREATTELWSQIGTVTDLASGRRFVGRIARRTGIFSGFFEGPGRSLIRSVRTLNVEDQELTSIALTTVRANYQTWSDILSAVAIPLFISFLGVGIGTRSVSAVIVMGAVAIFYVCWFVWFRVSLGVAIAACDALKVIRETDA